MSMIKQKSITDGASECEEYFDWNDEEFIDCSDYMNQCTPMYNTEEKRVRVKEFNSWLSFVGQLGLKFKMSDGKT